MSPEPVRTFGRTPTAAARGAAVLALLGVGAVTVVLRLLTRPGTPVGEAFAATGIPAPLVVGIGAGAVIALAAAGYLRAVRSAERFVVSAEALEVTGPMGSYRIEWSNVREAGAGPGGGLGINVRSRAQLLATFRGTDAQREWLRTLEPFGEWDLLYHRAETGHDAGEILAWLSPYLETASG
jgi:hypothetical protein